MIRLILAGIACLALTLSGCKGACRKLSEKLCDCSDTTYARQSCILLAGNKESQASPTAADNAVCQPLIATCDCHALDSAVGKQNCGLALRPDAGAASN